MLVMSRTRDIFFHEDDYCQQQLLARAAAEFAGAELKRIEDFAEAHRAPGGLGWTEMYIRKESPAELRSLKINRNEFASIVSQSLPPFDAVYTGYSTYREECKKTAARGRSERCALLADWNDDGLIVNVWAEFFDQEEEAILAASTAVAAMGKRYPLIYVDWAWGYRCEADDSAAFSSMLRSKLDAIAKNLNTFERP